MGKMKQVLMTIAAGVTVGAVLGILYAPQKGTDTRKKLKKLKAKLSGVADEHDEDKETLQELSAVLQDELDKINGRLKKM